MGEHRPKNTNWELAFFKGWSVFSLVIVIETITGSVGMVVGNIIIITVDVKSLPHDYFVVFVTIQFHLKDVFPIFLSHDSFLRMHLVFFFSLVFSLGFKLLRLIFVVFARYILLLLSLHKQVHLHR